MGFDVLGLELVGLTTDSSLTCTNRKKHTFQKMYFFIYKREISLYIQMIIITITIFNISVAEKT